LPSGAATYSKAADLLQGRGADRVEVRHEEVVEHRRHASRPVIASHWNVATLQVAASLLESAHVVVDGWRPDVSPHAERCASCVSSATWIASVWGQSITALTAATTRRLGRMTCPPSSPVILLAEDEATAPRWFRSCPGRSVPNSSTGTSRHVRRCARRSPLGSTAGDWRTPSPTASRTGCPRSRWSR
jgi:hypothetical protein